MLVALYRLQMAPYVVVWHGGLSRPGTTTKGELIDPAGWDRRPDPRLDEQRMNWGYISKTEMLTAQGKIGRAYPHRRRPPAITPTDPQTALDSLPIADSELRTGDHT